VLDEIGDDFSNTVKLTPNFLMQFSNLLDNASYKSVIDPLISGAHVKLLGHGVNNAEEAAMKLFIMDNYYRNFNKALSGEIEMKPEYFAMKELMESAHSKLPKVDGPIVFRGAGADESTFAGNLLNGQTFNFNGRFTSSSYDEFTADMFRRGNGGNVIWRIEPKTGVDIAKINASESEVIFKPFTNYELLNIEPSASNPQVLFYNIKEL
jgi:hypothetical protein